MYVSRALLPQASLLPLLASCCYISAAHAAETDPSDLLSMSLQELTNIEVTSVSKKSEKASEAAAAIFVLTAEDIQRLGATSIPEALRVVPGINVAQAGSHQWAVSSRGFNDQFANKLLVLIDGRSVYTPLFSGVWWDVQDVMLQDIERIEVIRGPGGTLWGANAVNGVINIITKKAGDTQGGIASLTAGTHERAEVATRYGTKLGDAGAVRVYAKYNDRDQQRSLTDTGAQDDWKKEQAGFRADWKGAEKHDFTLQGDIYTVSEMLPWNLPSLSAPPTEFSLQDKNPHGGNVLGRWHYNQSAESDLTLQMYFDRAVRDHLGDDSTDTYDVDFQHVWTGVERNEFIWGIGYRLIDNSLADTIYYTQLPLDRKDSLYSAFLQDKIAIVPNEFFLTLGSKFEHNEYTGFEYQPTARFTWLLNDKQTLWGAVSRAIHTPSSSTQDGTLALAYNPPPPIGGFITSQGNPQLESEELIAYELGFRTEVMDKAYVDTTVFYNDYDKLFLGALNSGAATVVGTGPFAPYLLIPIIPGNDNSGRSFGFEVAANWDVTTNWQLASGYSFIDLDFDKPFVGFSFEGKEPQQTFNVRSTLRLPYNLEMNNTVYYVDSLTGARIPNYIRLDSRLAWKAMEGVELSLVGQNLLDDQHPEFSGFVYQNSEQIGRSVYGNVTFRF